MAQKKPYRVARSRTGLGLFATAPIEKGAFIIEYKGRRITNAESARREARGARFMFELDSRWTVDGSSRRNIARYANHSCRPNAESDVVRRQVILRAIKNIKPGDEITYDYGPDYFEIFLEPAGCKCDKCRAKRRKQRQSRRLGSKRKTRR
jgi:SET domain-containing protein